MKCVTAYIALGSNLGDREQAIRAAIGLLGQTPGIEVAAVSSIIETPPMGPAGQRSYLNAAARLETELPCRSLLDRALDIEVSLGRQRSREQRWGSRRLDIDILLYGEMIIDQPNLRVPHAQMHERSFVLIPLAEIAPQVIHPVFGVSIERLLKTLRSGRADNAALSASELRDIQL